MKTTKLAISGIAIILSVGLSLASSQKLFSTTQGYAANVSTCSLRPIANISGSQTCDTSFTGPNCKVQVGESLVDAYLFCSATTNPVTVTGLLKRNN